LDCIQTRKTPIADAEIGHRVAGSDEDNAAVTAQVALGYARESNSHATPWTAAWPTGSAGKGYELPKVQKGKKESKWSEEGF
jgi:hypothetical protein